MDGRHQSERVGADEGSNVERLGGSTSSTRSSRSETDRAVGSHSSVRLSSRTPLVWIKLGGSLITNKTSREELRLDILTAIASTIKSLSSRVKILIGHGSGSFGHFYASEFNIRAGVSRDQEWMGFALTADSAARLHRRVVSALLLEGVPAIGIQSSCLLTCRNGKVVSGNLESVSRALESELVPVVYGDVCFDQVLGGTVVSTEELFEYMLGFLSPCRIVIAGETLGVFDRNPDRFPDAKLIEDIDKTKFESIRQGLGHSRGVDVTGGMLSKVSLCIDMIERRPGLQIIICSGLEPRQLSRAIQGERIGTLIQGHKPNSSAIEFH